MEKEMFDNVKRGLCECVKPEYALTENELNGICAACNGWWFRHTNTMYDIVDHLQDYYYYNPGESKQFWETDADLEKTIEKLMSGYHTPERIFLYVMFFWERENVLEKLVDFLILD